MQHRNPQESQLPEIIRLLSTYHALTLLQLEAFYPESPRIGMRMSRRNAASSIRWLVTQNCVQQSAGIPA